MILKKIVFLSSLFLLGNSLFASISPKIAHPFNLIYDQTNKTYVDKDKNIILRFDLNQKGWVGKDGLLLDVARINDNYMGIFEIGFQYGNPLYFMKPHCDDETKYPQLDKGKVVIYDASLCEDSIFVQDVKAYFTRVVFDYHNLEWIFFDGQANKFEFEHNEWIGPVVPLISDIVENSDSSDDIAQHWALISFFEDLKLRRRFARISHFNQEFLHDLWFKRESCVSLPTWLAELTESE
ncbi:MAG: hypothetical protein P4L31_01320 [Candidatus Babeliales bacterium]|nr:hypothetical protein [Candidatus Babeliales bacterium]